MLDKQLSHRVFVHIFNVIQIRLPQFVCSCETSLLLFLLFLYCLLSFHLFHLDLASAKLFHSLALFLFQFLSFLNF